MFSFDIFLAESLEKVVVSVLLTSVIVVNFRKVLSQRKVVRDSFSILILALNLRFMRDAFSLHPRSRPSDQIDRLSVTCGLT